MTTQSFLTKQATQLKQLTRDSRNYSLAKKVLFENLLACQQEQCGKFENICRAMHNEHAKRLNVKLFDQLLPASLATLKVELIGLNEETI